MEKFEFSRTQNKFLLDRGVCQEQIGRLRSLLPVVHLMLTQYRAASHMRPALVGIEDAASKLGALLRALLCASDQDSRNAQAVIETGGKMWGLMVVEGRASPPTCVVVPQAISMLDAISTAARAGLKLCEGRDGRPSGLGAAAVGMIHQTLAFGWHAEARRGNAPKKHWDVVLRPAVETCFDVVGAAASIEWSLKQYGKQRGAQALALENMFAQRATARGSHPDREET